jgi:hypothetical protein
MKVKQTEALYYQFELQKSFIPKKITENVHDKEMAIAYATRQLASFINDFIICDHSIGGTKRINTDVHYEKMTLITSDENEYKNIKDFCNYLIDSGELLNLMVNCFITGKNSFHQYGEGLKNAHKTYEYLKLEKEIPINESNDQKKLKL